jgi:hypothetical protein
MKIFEYYIESEYLGLLGLLIMGYENILTHFGIRIFGTSRISNKRK